MREIIPFIAICILAAVRPLFPEVSSSMATELAFSGWPTQLASLPLRQVDLSKRETRFDTAFPGRTAKFTDGHRSVLIRWVTKPTRKLHPASDCYKGSGYSIRPLPLRLDADGFAWGCFEATRGHDTVRVLERIHDNSGKAWTDVSSWYWHALLGRSDGPWWAVTVVESWSPVNSPQSS